MKLLLINREMTCKFINHSGPNLPKYFCSISFFVYFRQNESSERGSQNDEVW